MINWQSILPLMQQGAKGVQGMFGGMPDYLKNLPAPQAGGAPQPQAQPEKTPWLQQQGFGGLQRGELLLAGMGMLGGRNFSEGLANTSGTLYGAMGRQSKEAEERKKREALLKAMTAGGMSPQQAEALAQFDPSIAFGQMNRAQDLEIDTARYNKGEEWKEKQWLRDQQRWETDQEWQQRIYDREGEQFDQTFGLSQAQFEEGKRQFNARQASDAAGASDYGLNIVWGRDEAGNYVPMQASKGGGLAAARMPQGVTLLGPQGTAFDTAMGKEEAKKAAYQTHAGQALQAALSKGDEVLAQIDKAVDQTSWWNTGLIGQMVFAGNLDATLDALGAKAMLSELVAIKAQGGTLGALSDAEGKALRDAAVAVSRSQDEKQLDANLKAYRLQVEKSMQRLQSAFEAEYVGQSYGRAPPVRGAAPQAPADLSGASDDDLFSILGGR